MNILNIEDIKEPAKIAQTTLKVLNEQLDQVEKAQTPDEFIELADKPIDATWFIMSTYRNAFIEGGVEARRGFCDGVMRLTQIGISKSDEMLSHPEVTQHQIDAILEKRHKWQDIANAF